MVIWFSAALAADTPTEDTDTPAVEAPEPVDVPVAKKPGELHVKHTVAPNYPDSSLPPGDCLVQVIVDRSGAAESVEARSCEVQPWFDAVRDALMQWRWDPPTQDGQPVRATMPINIKFRMKQGATYAASLSREQLDAIVAAHQLVDMPTEDCAMAVTLRASGDIDAIGTSELPACLLIPGGGFELPGKLVGALAEPVQCQLALDSYGGAAHGVAFTACPKAWQTPVRKAVEKWSWNAPTDGHRRYDVMVTVAP
ncbi:MAG: energy transducer TonB [Myxococcales bacterium]|nr:energy transducer TonB [Myxococcales bacterium]